MTFPDRSSSQSKSVSCQDSSLDDLHRLREQIVILLGTYKSLSLGFSESKEI